MNRFAVRDDISFTNEGGVGLFKESLATIEIILIIKPEPPRAPGPGHPILWMCEVPVAPGPGHVMEVQQDSQWAARIPFCTLRS